MVTTRDTMEPSTLVFLVLFCGGSRERRLVTPRGPCNGGIKVFCLAFVTKHQVHLRLFASTLVLNWPCVASLSNEFDRAQHIDKAINFFSYFLVVCKSHCYQTACVKSCFNESEVVRLKINSLRAFDTLLKENTRRKISLWTIYMITHLLFFGFG